MRIEVGEWMTDLLEEHAEEAAFLWMQRQDAMASAEYTVRAVRRLEARIAAHTDALVLAGSAARPFLEPGLAGDHGAALAAAYALLLSGDPGDGRVVMAALREAEGPALDGLRDGLCHGSIEGVGDSVRELLRTGEPAVAAAAAEALAFHGIDGVDARDVERFLHDASPAVRAGGWRTIAFLGARLDPSLYAAALRDDDEAVRHAGLLAAAWCGVPGALQVVRQAAMSPATADPFMLRLFAVLAAPQEWSIIQHFAADPALGPLRFELIATFGRPDGVELLIDAMGDDDPAASAAAGAAFRRMTGIDVDGPRVVLPGGDDEDDVDEEFRDEVALPDAKLARRGWDELKSSVAGAGRLCAGIDVDQPLTSQAVDGMDMRSRWEIALRAGFRGVPRAAAAVQRMPLTPLPLEAPAVPVSV